MPNVIQKNKNFRYDINGLRAWSVLAVIFYHFGIPGFNGGFIGVDVFFVISGFLMTAIVVRGLEQGNFSLPGFYMARARRIVPVLLGLCTALLAIGWIALPPPDYKILATHTLSSLSFLSNFKFFDEAGYFDAASHEKWLLHTWSLSVEWQFYLILPIALRVVWRIYPGRPAQVLTVLTGLIVSFGLSALTTNPHPTAAFFLLHTRAWEMLAGGLVFLAGTSIRASAIFGKWLERFGLLLIITSVVIFDTETTWPSWKALLPVMAAMMVLTSNRISFWTNNPLMQWLGSRSYSLYLWHWPVFVALAYVNLQYTPTAIISGILLTMILGDLSYRLLEVPAQHLLSHLNLRRGATLLILITSVLLVSATAIRILDGIRGRFSPMVEAAAAEANNINPRREECHPAKGKVSPSCIWGGNNWSAIAVGDSHVSSSITGLAVAAPVDTAGVIQWSYSGCPYIPGLHFSPEKKAKLGSDYQCEEFIEWARTQFDKVPYNIPVVIIGRYALLTAGKNQSGKTVLQPEIYFSDTNRKQPENIRNELAQHITNSACELAKNRTVYLMRPIPDMNFDVPKTLSRRLAFGLIGDVSVSLEDYHKKIDWLWVAQDKASTQCGVKILDPIPYLCHDGRCYGSKNGRPIYSDDNHLSEFGNKLITPMFRQVFETINNKQ